MAADCCATIVTPLEEAMRDPHFIERGLFAHEVATASGKTMPALPVPIAKEFRETPGAKKVPKGTLFFIGQNGQLYMRTGPYLEGDGKFMFGTN